MSCLWLVWLQVNARAKERASYQFLLHPRPHNVFMPSTWISARAYKTRPFPGQALMMWIFFLPHKIDLDSGDRILCHSHFVKYPCRKPAADGCAHIFNECVCCHCREMAAQSSDVGVEAVVHTWRRIFLIELKDKQIYLLDILLQNSPRQGNSVPLLFVLQAILEMERNPDRQA